MQPQEQYPSAQNDGNMYGQYAPTAAQAPANERARFLVKTYMHLVGAIFAFVAIIAGIFASGYAETIARTMLGVSWLLVLAAFMGVSYAANMLARSGASQAKQYAGLGLYVVAEAFLFVPLIYIAVGAAQGAGASTAGLELLAEAGAITVGMFAGLSAVVFLTRMNFSFLRGALMFGFFAALALIVLSIVFSFDLGIIFVWAMVVLASLSILYSTSRVLHDYDTRQYVAAALTLFASFALLLWYVIQILMSRR